MANYRFYSDTAYHNFMNDMEDYGGGDSVHGDDMELTVYVDDDYQGDIEIDYLVNQWGGERET